MEWTTSVCDGTPPAQTFLCSELGSFAILFVSIFIWSFLLVFLYLIMD